MKPRILFLLSELVTGGAERQTVLLAKQLVKLGYSCNLLAYYAEHSAIVVDNEIRPYVNFISGKSMRCVLEWRKAWSMIAESKPDVIIAVNPSVLPVAVLGRALGRYDASIACVFHSTVLADAKTRLLFPISRLALRFTDCLIYVCNAQRDYWECRNLRARSADVIHNGVDVARYAAAQVSLSANEAKAKLGFAPTDYVIGLTASFRPEKNHIQAVDALVALRNAGVPAKLLLVGDGKTRQEVERHVAALSLERDVLFAGVQRDVRPYLKAMDVGVLCSTGVETFSLAALEAMAMGVPMVMPRMSGCVEMVEGDRGGRLFEVGNTNELVVCLEHFYDAAVREKAAAEAPAVIFDRFTEEKMAEKYRLLIDGLFLSRLRPQGFPTAAQSGSSRP